MALQVLFLENKDFRDMGACKNPEKPTENHYRMPNLEKKAEHKEKLYDLLKTSFSKDFIARLEVYFSKSYLETYLVEEIS